MHVAHIWMTNTGVSDVADIKPFEVGARGQAVQLWAVHYHVYNSLADVALTWLGIALCENPDIADKYPGGPAAFRTGFGSVLFQRTASLYGRATWHMRRGTTGLGDTGSYNRDVNSVIVPLYGIVRPRRQVLLACGIGYTAKIDVGAEIYYTAVGGVPDLISAVDLARGKYRRS